MATKEGRVRLSEEAHSLCAEKAHDCDVSMKAVASEAIFLMFSKEKAQEDCKGLIEEGKNEIKKEFYMRLYQQKRDDKRYAFGTFILGAITGGALMFFVGIGVML